MGHVSDGLNCLFKPGKRQLVEDQREDDGGREAHQQIQQIQLDGVSQSQAEVLAAESLDEILEAVVLGQGHFPDAHVQLILLESDLDVNHRGILKYQQVQQRKHQQRVQLPIPFDIGAEAAALFLQRQL